MKAVTYKCDACGYPLPEDSIVKVEISHNRTGKFDLRDEEFEFCPGCMEEVLGLLKQLHDKEKTV